MSAPSIDRARLRALLERTVSCYSPSYAEQEVVALYEQALTELGFGVERQPVPSEAHPGRHNLITSVGPEPPALMLLGHVDTIALQPGEVFGPRWDGDTYRGLGTADMKGGCAAMIEALAATRSCDLRRGVLLALVVGEEDVGDGAAALLEEHVAPLVIVGEPTGLVACAEHFGYLELALSVRGKRAHAALPEVGHNAIEGMLSWIGALRELVDAEPALAHVVMSVRTIDGGSALFAVPERCRAVLDIHLPPGAEAAPVEDAVRRIGTGLPSVETTVERRMWAPGESADPNASRLRSLRRALASLGLPTETTPFRSHSDANLFHGRDATAVVLGPGTLNLAHTRAEHVDFDEVVRAAQLYATLIVEACGP